VKWLTGIEVIDREFSGHYQGDKYRYEWEREGRSVSEPVTLQRVRALITEPSPQTEVPSGDLAIRGVAWSGAAPIARIEVSVNGGESFNPPYRTPTARALIECVYSALREGTCRRAHEPRVRARRQRSLGTIDPSPKTPSMLAMCTGVACSTSS